VPTRRKKTNRQRLAMAAQRAAVSVAAGSPAKLLAEFRLNVGEQAAEPLDEAEVEPQEIAPAREQTAVPLQVQAGSQRVREASPR
jgi:hypothetical protein